jgi:hypothetical protein
MASLKSRPLNPIENIWGILKDKLYDRIDEIESVETV